MAIQGRGFFQVLLPSGTIAYTRAGNFAVNGQGQEVTQDGYLLQPAMTVPQNAKSVSISPTGIVQATLDRLPQVQEFRDDMASQLGATLVLLRALL